MSEAPPQFVEQLKAVVLQRITEDDLVLPALPRVVQRAVADAEHEPFDPGRIAAILESDPLATARLVRVANSPAFAVGAPAVTVERAVERVGQSTLRSFLEKVSAETVFTSHDEAINQACLAFWKHSLAVGLLSRRLAAVVLGEQPNAITETAHLAGLLHDVGKIILAAMLLDAERRLLGTQATRTWLSADAFVTFVQQTHRTIGLLVAAKWELPAIVRRGISDAVAYEEDEPLAVPNFVRLANALAKEGGIYLGEVDAKEEAARVEAGAKLLGLSAGAVRDMCQGLSQEVAARLG